MARVISEPGMGPLFLRALMDFSSVNSFMNF